VKDDISEELQSHLDLHTADNIRAGMSPDEARRQAMIALGGVQQTKERYRERGRTRWLDELTQDARFGIRTLIRNPGLTLIAVLSLALATGATAAIFSIVNGVLRRPLPFGDPSRLVQIAETSMLRDDLEALRRQSAGCDRRVDRRRADSAGAALDCPGLSSHGDGRECHDRGRGCRDVRDRARRVVAAGRASGSHRAGFRAARGITTGSARLKSSRLVVLDLSRALQRRTWNVDATTQT
jgi:hypothetical protein